MERFPQLPSESEKLIPKEPRLRGIFQTLELLRPAEDEDGETILESLSEFLKKDNEDE